MENFTTKFQQSYICLQKFLDNWTEKIQDRCLGDDQRKASFYIWARYTMSIRTFHRICEPRYIPDIYVIARSCLECDASLMGVMADAGLAKAYLEFPERARAYYGTVLENLGLSSELAKLEPDLKKSFGDNWRKKRRIHWAQKQGGISKLVEQYGGSELRCYYAQLSHFTHGSALALEVLQGTSPTRDQLDSAVLIVYGAYVPLTSDFLDFAWGLVVTADSESCKSEFVHSVMRTWI